MQDRTLRCLNSCRLSTCKLAPIVSCKLRCSCFAIELVALGVLLLNRPTPCPLVPRASVPCNSGKLAGKTPEEVEVLKKTEGSVWEPKVPDVARRTSVACKLHNCLGCRGVCCLGCFSCKLTNYQPLTDWDRTTAACILCVGCAGILGRAGQAVGNPGGAVAARWAHTELCAIQTTAAAGPPAQAVAWAGGCRPAAATVPCGACLIFGNFDGLG